MNISFFEFLSGPYDLAGRQGCRPRFSAPRKFWGIILDKGGKMEMKCSCCYHFHGVSVYKRCYFIYWTSNSISFPF